MKKNIIKDNSKTQSLEGTIILEKKLTGHKHWVNSVAVSPDGKWAVSGSDDKSIKIWDLDSGQCRGTLEGHTNKVNCVSVTPDGTRIISGSDDETICVWNYGNGHLLKTCMGHQHYVLSITSLPDGKRALSSAAGGDPTIKLWELDSGQCLKTLKGHTNSITSVAVTWDGKRAISGSYDKTIKYWDLENGQCLGTLTGHAGCINSVQITPDGRYAISGSDDNTVKLWDLITKTCKGTFEGHKDRIHSVSISPDGTLAASTGFQDFTLRVWDLKDNFCVQVITDEKDYFAPVSAAFTPDGSRLLAGTNEGNLYSYSLTGFNATPLVEEGQRYINAKVVLVGESGVGKSGLAHRLIEDKFVQTSSTHGMQVWRLDLPIDDRGGMEKEVLLWDLAGQEDYRLIHQLFLGETSLVLILINPQKEDPFADVMDWIKALHTAVSFKDKSLEAVRLLIAARTDVGTIKVSQNKINCFRKENGFVDYLPTSALTGENCSDNLNGNQSSALKKLITQYIPWTKLPWTSTPRLLRELKNAVLAMKEGENVSLLRFSELMQRLKQGMPKETFKDIDVRAAVNLLSNHGLVMLLKFGDLVLLSPELVNSYASAVIHAARTHIDEIGTVSEQDVFGKKIDLKSVSRLPDADEDLLLRALVQIFLDKSLCISEETAEGKQLIFPSQYRRERTFSEHPDISVSYTFSGELTIIYTTLVVRLWYSQLFEKKELWRNAAEFTTSKGQIAGLIMERNGEGVGTISVFFDPYVPDELKAMFIEYVHQHLHKYDADVRRGRLYICSSCSKPVKDLEAVSFRLKSKKNFIYCAYCDERIDLIDHIEKPLASDSLAQTIIEMDQRARSKLDNQALEQILIGHMMSICGEANQIFRHLLMFDYGIDGEVEFKDQKGNPSGKKIYVQLKSGSSHLRDRKMDQEMVFDVKNERHLEYWQSQPVDVYLVIRDKDKKIRWMNVTLYLKTRKDKKSRQISFSGEKLDAQAIEKARDIYTS